MRCVRCGGDVEIGKRNMKMRSRKGAKEMGYMHFRPLGRYCQTLVFYSVHRNQAVWFAATPSVWLEIPYTRLSLMISCCPPDVVNLTIVQSLSWS